MSKCLKMALIGLMLFRAAPSFAAVSCLHDGASWICDQLQQIEMTPEDELMNRKRLVSFKESEEYGDVSRLGGIIVRKSSRILNYFHGRLLSGLWYWVSDLIVAYVIILLGVYCVGFMGHGMKSSGIKVNPFLFEWMCVIPGIIPVIAYFWIIPPIVDDILLILLTLFLILPFVFLGLNIQRKGSVLSCILMLLFAPLTLILGVIAAGLGAYLFGYILFCGLLLIFLFCGGKSSRPSHSEGDREVLEDGTRIRYTGMGRWEDEDHHGQDYEETCDGRFRKRSQKDDSSRINLFGDHLLQRKVFLYFCLANAFGMIIMRLLLSSFSTVACIQTEAKNIR